MSLYDLLKPDIQRMVNSLDKHDKGNIYPLVMQEVERSLIDLVLKETGYNYVHAAKALGISRSTLYRRIEVLGIQPTKT